MILALIVSVLISMLVLMAGFYFLHFSREKNLGKTHIIIGNAVVVFSLLVILGAFICSGVHCAMGSCHKNSGCGKSSKCEKMEKSCHGSCDAEQAMCSSKSKSCGSDKASCSSMKSGHCDMKGGHGDMSIEKEIIIEKETVDENGNKKVEVEVIK